ncbi:hypothetical protein FRC00_000896 [Tulasnella sp. 408]|nr:hypothetical protein FRC00_000896 [Tulasnella sp. 408]
MKQLRDVIRRRKEWVVYVSKHAKLCREWDPPLASVEVMEREEGRKRLIAYLKNLGYPEEDAQVALVDSDLDLTIGLDLASE